MMKRRTVEEESLKEALAIMTVFSSPLLSILFFRSEFLNGRRLFFQFRNIFIKISNIMKTNVKR